jgi:hypothetical protein
VHVQQLPNMSLYVIPGGACTFRGAGIISAIYHYDSNYKQLLHVAAVTQFSRHLLRRKL